MSFTVEDALISPQGLAVLSGAGLYKAGKGENLKHVHVSLNSQVGASNTVQVTLGQILEELGLEGESNITVCNSTDVPAYGMLLDAGGFIKSYVSGFTMSGQESTEYNEGIVVDASHPLTLTSNTAIAQGETIKLDFYVIRDTGVTEIEIKPSDFGGYFYVEAQTLFRREDNGKDMAAEIIIPKAKVQSAMTISMSASGDPSTYNFTMDAFPGYTKFDKTKKVMCVIQIIGDDNEGAEEGDNHSWKDHEKNPTPPTPVTYKWNKDATKVFNYPGRLVDPTESIYESDRGTYAFIEEGGTGNVVVGPVNETVTTWGEVPKYGNFSVVASIEELGTPTEAGREGAVFDADNIENSGIYVSEEA